MRLFTGIALPRDVIAHLTRLIEHLRTTAHLKWSPPYNLHITTKFIGEWPEERLPEMIDALRAIKPLRRFDVNIRGFGWFPNPHHPRVLWVGVHASEALHALAKATDDATAALGVRPEEKPYSPHLTLARMKEPVPLFGLQRAIADLKTDDFGTFTADRFHLYLSVPGPASSIYTQLAEFPLTEK